MSGPNDPELSRVEARLAALAPVGRPPDRDRLLIALGRARGLRAAWPWRVATVALAVLSAGLGWQVASPRQQVVERFAVVPAGPPALSADPGEPYPAPGEDGYWRLRERAFHGGVDSLPERRPGAGPFLPPVREPDLPADLRSLRRSSL
jgi:hypothetical protein